MRLNWLSLNRNKGLTLFWGLHMLPTTFYFQREANFILHCTFWNAGRVVGWNFDYNTSTAQLGLRLRLSLAILYRLNKRSQDCSAHSGIERRIYSANVEGLNILFGIDFCIFVIWFVIIMVFIDISWTISWNFKRLPYLTRRIDISLDERLD